MYPDKYERQDKLYGRTFKCVYCGEDCAATYVDNGIGRYEFWGSVGFDTRIELVSVCCEDEVEEY